MELHDDKMLFKVLKTIR